MEVLIDPGEYSLSNVGDIAMLQVATRRLGAIPCVESLSVLTDAPERLEILCPGARPVSAQGRAMWLSGNVLTGRFASALPEGVRGFVSRLESRLRNRAPRGTRRLVILKKRLRGKSWRELDEFLQASSRSEVLVLSGQGSLTDAFVGHALQILETIRWASRAGRSVLMFGQGIGPITDPTLISRMEEVMPKVALIALREGVLGPSTLEKLGAQPGRISVTGDDALELVVGLPHRAAGNEVGLSLRSTFYSGIQDGAVQGIALGVRQALAHLDAALRPIPMSTHPDEDDARVLQEATGTAFESPGMLTPQIVIEWIQRCRVVVAGSYHAAVLALGQGVPVVALAGSPYYEAKFRGLRELFGNGIRIPALGDPNTLAAAIAEAWDFPQPLRLKLREAAESQVKSAREAYSVASSILGSSHA